MQEGGSASSEGVEEQKQIELAAQQFYGKGKGNKEEQFLENEDQYDEESF